MLPYIADRELFISHIKYSMNQICAEILHMTVLCKTACTWIIRHQFFAKMDLEFLYDKYKDKIYRDMGTNGKKDWGLMVRKK